ncbi:MAG: phasin family protein [Betaproteobacteria bacterium]|nr:MAG: phasin family protein [Betaproteobacteria bacterium]
MDQAKAGQATSTSLFGDFSKLIEQFKLPGIDLNALMEARRKDIDALAAANRTALEGIQSLNQKQAEILRATMDQLQSIVKTAAGSATSASTGEIVQQALQKAFLSMRELAEVAYKSQSDAFAVVSQRAQENIQEVKGLLQPKK